MQTFLVYPDYLQSMRSLDKYRLGNQVWREGLTLLRGGWPNHPAARMWKGHEYHLGLYLLDGLKALEERGKVYPKVRCKIEIEMAKFSDTGAPAWIGNTQFHASHRSNLLRKVNEAVEKAKEATEKNDAKKHRLVKVADYIKTWYSQFEWAERADLPYVWPISEQKIL